MQSERNTRKRERNTRWSREASSSGSATARLADAWDAEVLRSGDTVDRGALGVRAVSDLSAKLHKDQWQPLGFIKLALRDLGKSGCALGGQGEAGIRDSRRRGEAVHSMAGLCQGLFLDRGEALLRRLKGDGHGQAIYLRRHLDSTPVHMHYGVLQGKLELVGRQFQPYMFVDPDTGLEQVRWRTIDAAEHRRLYPKHMTRSGVLDLAVMHGKMVRVDHEEGYQEHSQLLIRPPRVLTSNTASVNMAALNTGSCFNLRAMKDLTSKSCVSVGETTTCPPRETYAIVDDCPDGCPTMMRFKRASAEYTLPHPNLFYNEDATCMAHILHNDIKSSMQEKQIVGHTHAVCHVFALDGRRRQLLGALKHLVHNDLECYTGSPPPSNVSHCRAILDATILRHESYIRGRCGIDDASDHSSPSMLRTQSQILLHCNGILHVDKITHWCWGCCQDETGATTREMQEANMVKALALLLGAMFAGQMPAINRWLSTGRLLGYILAGMLFHRVLPRSWRLAFGEGEVPRSLEDLGDFKTYTKSKVRRVCIWFALEDTCSSAFVYAFVAAPAEHLLQEIQVADVAGSCLRSLSQTRTNPFWSCLSTYFTMLLHPMTSSLAPVWRHFEGHGLHFVSVVSWVSWATALHLAAQIWRDCAMVLADWPYRLVDLVMDDEGLFDAAAEDLFTVPECCLDRCMSLKIARLLTTYSSTSGTKIKLPRGVLFALRAWSRHARLTNMCTERLINSCLRAAPRRCHAIRLLSSGFLRQIDNEHIRAGGRRVQTTKRSDLMTGDVPTKSSSGNSRGGRTRGIPTRAPKAQTAFAKWANAKMRQRRCVLGGRRRSNREEYLASIALLKVQWAAGERGDHPNDLPRATDDSGAGPTYADRINHDLWQISTPRCVLCPNLLLEEAARIAGPQTRGGLTAALKPARDSFLDAAVVSDSGQIPASWKASYKAPCCRIHPGFCRDTVDGAERFWQIHEALCRALRAWNRGTLFAMEWVGEGMSEKHHLLYALANGEDEKRIVLLRCDSDPLPAPRSVPGHGLDFCMSHAALLQVRVSKQKKRECR